APARQPLDVAAKAWAGARDDTYAHAPPIAGKIMFDLKTRGPADPHLTLRARPLLRRAYCHAGYRLHANKVVAHNFNAAHILGCENKRPTLSLIEECTPKFDGPVAHDYIDQADWCPALLIQLRQHTLTDCLVIGRCRFDLPGQACERVKQVGAADNPYELVVAQHRQAFDAV